MKPFDVTTEPLTPDEEPTEFMAHMRWVVATVAKRFSIPAHLLVEEPTNYGVEDPAVNDFRRLREGTYPKVPT